MATVREAYDEFEALIERQEKARTALRTEENALYEDVRTNKIKLDNAINAAIPSVKPEILAALDKVANKAGQKSSYAETVARKQAMDVETVEALASWDRFYTSVESCRATAELNQRELEKLGPEIKAYEKRISEINERLKYIVEFNRGTFEEINSASIPDYQKFQFWRYLTDENYRKARAIIEVYHEKSGNYSDDTMMLAESSSLLMYSKQKLANIESSQRTLESAISSRAALQAKYNGPERILAQIRNDVSNLAASNERFAGALSAWAGNGEIMLAALKIRNLQGAAARIEQQRNAVEKTIEQLNDTRSKLGRVVYRAGSKQLKGFDLDEYKKSLNSRSVLAGNAVINAAQFRAATANYIPTPASNDPFMWQNMFMYYLLINSTVHASFVNEAMGVTPQILEETGLKAEDLKPDFSALGGSAILEGISATELTQATQQLETSLAIPDLSLETDRLTIPVMEMPTIETPQIDTYVPDTTPTYSDPSPGGGGFE